MFLEQIENMVTCIRIDSGRTTRKSVTVDSRLKQDLDLDSLDLAVLAVKIEAETGIDVFADGVVETVGEIVEKLERNNLR
jgi:acyl carrier protein